HSRHRQQQLAGQELRLFDHRSTNGPLRFGEQGLRRPNSGLKARLILEGACNMTIQVGDRLPDVPLTTATAEGPKPTTSAEFFKSKRVALFAVPGAFTPTCSARHLPSYVDKAEELKKQGIDEIACISVNDPFVMAAWGQRD